MNFYVINTCYSDGSDWEKVIINIDQITRIYRLPSGIFAVILSDNDSVYLNKESVDALFTIIGVSLPED